MESRQAGLSEPNLAIELIDRGLRLRNEVLLCFDLRIEGLDQRVGRIDLVLDRSDLPLDVLQLLLVVDLLPDALVVREARLVDGRRVAGVAVERRRRLHGQRGPYR